MKAALVLATQPVNQDLVTKDTDVSALKDTEGTTVHWVTKEGNRHFEKCLFENIH